MTTIQLRRGTSAEWVAANPILAPGEIGVELDTNKFKIGDGVTYWSVAEYYVPAPDVIAAIQADMAAHLAAANPHPQYGSASGLPDHIAAVDPHPQYASDADLAAHVAHANPHPVYATDVDLTTHISAPDPHPQYATDADLTAHVAAANPHPVYATDSDLLAHRTDPSAHSQYALDAEFDAYVEAADVIYEKKSELLKEALWWVDAGAAKNDRLVDLSGNGRDAVFGAGTARPIVLPWDGEDYVYTPEAAGNGPKITTPINSWATSSVVEIDLTLLKNPAADTYVMYTASGVSSVICIQSTGNIRLVGTVTDAPFTGVNLPVGVRTKIRVETSPTATTMFFDGVQKWTGATTPPTTSVNSYFNLTGAGSAQSSVPNVRIYSASLVKDGVEVLRLDPRNVSADYSTIKNTGSAGGNWTIARAATGYKTAVVNRPLLLFGGAGQYADAIFPATTRGTRVMAFRAFANRSNTHLSYHASNGGMLWYYSNETTVYNIAYGLDSSSTTRNDFTTTAYGQHVVAAALGSTYRAWVDGVPDAVDGPVTNGVMVKDRLRIGSSALPTNFEFIADAFFDRALTDAEIAQVSQELAGTPHNKQSDPHPQYALESTIGNLLTENQASGTDTLGDTTGFLGSSATLTSDAAAAIQGTRGLKVVGASAGGFYVGSTYADAPARGLAGGQPVTFVVSMKAPAITRTGTMYIYWYTETGPASTPYSFVSLPPLSTVAAERRITAVAPADATRAGARVVINFGAAGEEAHIDRIGLWKGAGGDWAMPGTPITGLQPSMDQVTLWADLPATGNWLGRKIHVTSGLGFCMALWDGTGWRVAPESDTGWRAATPSTGWSLGSLRWLRRGPTVSVNADLAASASAPLKLADIPIGFGIDSNVAGRIGILARSGGYRFAMQMSVATDLAVYGAPLDGSGNITVLSTDRMYVDIEWACNAAWPTTPPA